MQVIDKSHDVTLSEMTAKLAEAPERRLVFTRDGRPLKRGYHVTEVKAGAFKALDCGANPEAWEEIFVQLWDVDEEGERGPLTAGRYMAIIDKVVEHVGLDRTARLTFEVSDGVEPMQILSADRPVEIDGVWTVTLRPRAASCKPRDRWLQAAGQACAGAASACCQGAGAP